MKQRPRIYYTEGQKALMWDRWRKGDSLQQIAQLFDRNHSSVQRILAETGAIQTAQRCRSRLALTLAEREETSRSVAAGQSIRAIAKLLGRAPSTVSQEIKRNGGREGYRASQADQAAWNRASRPKICKLVENRALAYIVAGKLRLQWSPEQIAGWLKRTYPSDETFQVSHESIYRSLFIHTRYAMLVKVTGKDTETVISALIKNARKLPEELYKSLTWDRGKKWPTTSGSPWRRTSRSTSVILRIPGCAGLVRTPTDY
jgi:DNA-binding CsgD family transcriptional regulator